MRCSVTSPWPSSSISGGRFRPMVPTAPGTAAPASGKGRAKPSGSGHDGAGVRGITLAAVEPGSAEPELLPPAGFPDLAALDGPTRGGLQANTRDRPWVLPNAEDGAERGTSGTVRDRPLNEGVNWGGATSSSAPTFRRLGAPRTCDWLPGNPRFRSAAQPAAGEALAAGRGEIRMLGDFPDANGTCFHFPRWLALPATDVARAPQPEPPLRVGQGRRRGLRAADDRPASRLPTHSVPVSEVRGRGVKSAERAVPTAPVPCLCTCSLPDGGEEPPVSPSGWGRRGTIAREKLTPAELPPAASRLEGEAAPERRASASSAAAAADSPTRCRCW